MKHLAGPRDVHVATVEALGLDPTMTDLTSPESIAAMVRRAASLRCPCPPRALVRASLQPLEGITDRVEDLRERIEDAVEALVAYGDLIESEDTRDSEAGPARLLFCAPPAFVARASGAVLLVGIAPDAPTPLPHDLAGRVETVNHVRRLAPSAGDDLPRRLASLGWLERSLDHWMKAPPREGAETHVARANRALAAAAPSGSVPGLLLLDPATKPTYYRGRWTEPRRHTGAFVARRPQAYGADRWSYVECEDGRPTRLVDLPLADDEGRGCDAAWRLQAAIDARRGAPQRLRRRPGPAGYALLDLFSPVPAWAQRRWDALGSPVSSRGALLTYRFADSEVDEEERFAREWIWLSGEPL